MPPSEPFFRTAESWRRILAEEIAAKNKVSAAGQSLGASRILNGLLFLRLAEAHGLESGLRALRDGHDVEARLALLFRPYMNVADVFFRLSDDVLRGILDWLYLPEFPLEIDILGQVYERQNTQARKAGGVFYTPPYIIETIVARSLEPLFEGLAAMDAKQVAILDPACGCGAFLLGACDWLFEWYRVRRAEGALTVQERAQIVRDHLHGVDIDPGAVEVTRLSLLLKAGVAQDLAGNIPCGNSLLGPDFTAKALRFDWAAQFPTVIARGGFDAVIGNPPYSNYSSRDGLRGFYGRSGQTVKLEALNKAIQYCCVTYADCSQGCKDLYKWFTAKALELTRPGGQFGFIIPNTWLTQPKYADLKRKIFAVCGDVEIIDLGLGVFSVVVPTCIVIARKGEGEQRRYADLKACKDKALALANCRFQPLQDDGRVGEHPLVRRFLQEWPAELKLKSWLTLREGQHILRSDLVKGRVPGLFPVIDSKNMGRYEFDWNPRYSFAPQGNFRTTSGARLVVRKTGDAIVAALTPRDEAFVLQSLYQGVFLEASLAPEYLLGLLNSKFLTFIYQNSQFGQKGRVLAQFRKGHLDDLPLPPFDLEKHDLLVELVKRRLGGEACEAEIDALVYGLYGLGAEEIGLVEEA